MQKYEGDDLVTIRQLIVSCHGHRTIFAQERTFLKDMERKAQGDSLVLTTKQDEWLLHIINRVVTDNSLFNGGR